MENKISIENCNLQYGEDKALKNININIKSNKITTLIGPSGSGKSSLMNAINRMNDLVQNCTMNGTILLDGKNIQSDIEINELRRRVGNVSKVPNLFPMSVYNNIAFASQMQGIKEKSELDNIVEHALREAQLWDELKDKLKKNAQKLPRGTQQRLCIARALSTHPDVLLLDEPTHDLDYVSTSMIEQLAVELKKDYTIIIATQNMRQTVRISDNTAFVLDGQIIEYNQTETLFSIPADSRTEKYITGRLG